MTNIFSYYDQSHRIRPCHKSIFSQMNFMNRSTLLIAISLILVGGCTSTKITSSWKAPNVNEKTFKKILVLGIMRESERSLREKMEIHMMGDLTEQGYYATSALEEYGPKQFSNLSEKEVISQLRNSGIDAVITIVMLDKQKERQYIPGKIYYTPYSRNYNQFYRYYNTLYDRIYMPGYYEVEHTKYFWESNLYDLNDGQLMYSLQTQSFDPNSAEALGHEYGKLIVKNMIEQGALFNNNAPKRGF